MTSSETRHEFHSFMIVHKIFSEWLAELPTFKQMASIQAVLSSTQAIDLHTSNSMHSQENELNIS